MKSSIIIWIVSDKDSWINDYIPDFIKQLSKDKYSVKWVNEIKKVGKGDICFLLSCSQIMPNKLIKNNKINLVVHESKVPKGKGWSPLSWQILEGNHKIPITMLEVVEKVDSGKIFLNDEMIFKGHELVDELRIKQKDYTFKLCYKFLKNYPEIRNKGRVQRGESSFFRKRTPASSELDINKTIYENFNLLKIVDNEKYPAFFNINGKKYKIKIERL
jgi:methionyl-tRNA formyltransferase